MKQLAAYSYI